MDSTKRYGKIAGILFLVFVVVNIILNVIGYIKAFETFNIARIILTYWTSFIEFVFQVILGIALLRDDYKLAKAASIVLTVLAFFNFAALAFYYFNTTSKELYQLFIAIRSLLNFIGYLLFCISFFKVGTKTAKTLCIISATVFAISIIFAINFTTIFLIAAVIFTGLYLERKDVSVTKINGPEASRSSIDKVTELKTLLDKGIITQEEFEEKKKQILN